MPFEDVKSALESIRDRSVEYINLDVDSIVVRLMKGELTLRGETVKVVDKSDVAIGEVDRKVAEKYGLIHRTSNAVVFTPAGKVILLRRGVPDKAFYLCLSIVGGHMGMLDDYEEGCKAEIAEELHLSTLPKSDLMPLGAELYDEPGDSNREIRNLFRCTLTQEEYRELEEFRKVLREAKGKSERDEFVAWLTDQRSAAKGYGEVWEYHEVDLSDLLTAKLAQPTDEILAKYLAKYPDGLHYMKVSETFAYATITENAFFTPDLLERIVRNSDQIQKLRETGPDREV